MAMIYVIFTVEYFKIFSSKRYRYLKPEETQESLFLKSTENSNSRTQYYLGKYYMSVGKYDEALKYFKLSYLQGNKKSGFEIMSYFYGNKIFLILRCMLFLQLKILHLIEH